MIALRNESFCCFLTTATPGLVRRVTCHSWFVPYHDAVPAARAPVGSSLTSTLTAVTLYHVSEERDIEVFTPRRINGADEALVWAVDEGRLHNYLVPRECPRVTFYAGPRTSVDDRERFLGSRVAVVAIEAAWLPRLRSCRLFCYHLPADNFISRDKTAGYFVSRTAVTPVSVECISDPMSAILQRGVELRVLPNLSSLRNAVVESTLEFSIIRWRNASPR